MDCRDNKRTNQEDTEQSLDKKIACPQNQCLIHFRWSCSRLCFEMTLQIRLLCFLLLFCLRERAVHIQRWFTGMDLVEGMTHNEHHNCLDTDSDTTNSLKAIVTRAYSTCSVSEPHFNRITGVLHAVFMLKFFCHKHCVVRLVKKN